MTPVTKSPWTLSFRVPTELRLFYEINNDKYALKFAENTIFNTRENIVELKKYFQNALTLKMMQFDVWNDENGVLDDDFYIFRPIFD